MHFQEVDIFGEILKFRVLSRFDFSQALKRKNVLDLAMSGVLPWDGMLNPPAYRSSETELTPPHTSEGRSPSPKSAPGN
jgi:hypothetical protein